MKYCYDTEFLEDGRTIDLISIGIVAEDGREYYAVSKDFNISRLMAHSWLMENVWPHLPRRQYPSGEWLDLSHPQVKIREQIAREVYDFLMHDASSASFPELWAYVGAFDHVALAWLWGPMCDLPFGIPMWTHDLKQLIEPLGPDFKKPVQSDNKHNALDDARWNYELLRAAQAASS